MAVRKAGRRDSPEGVQSLQRAVASEADRLRELLRETSERWTAEIESEIVEAVEMMGEIPGSAQKKLELQAVLDEMRGLKVKPRKGRLRDLKRIDKLVRQTTRRLEDLL